MLTIAQLIAPVSAFYTAWSSLRPIVALIFCVSDGLKAGIGGGML